MESFTLADLRRRARLYANERQAGRLTDAALSLDDLINEEARQARSWVLSSGGAQCYAVKETWSLRNGIAEYVCSGAVTTSGTDLAMDRLLELHIEWSATHHERIPIVDGATFEQLSQGTWAEYGRKGALLRGQSLFLAPTPSTTTTLSCEYVPRFTAFTTTDSSMLGPEGLAEIIALETAILVRGNVDKSTTVLERKLERARKWVVQAISRIVGHDCPKVRDVNPEQDLNRFGPNRWWDREPPA